MSGTLNSGNDALFNATDFNRKPFSLNGWASSFVKRHKEIDPIVCLQESTSVFWRKI